MGVTSKTDFLHYTASEEDLTNERRIINSEIGVGYRGEGGDVMLKDGLYEKVVSDSLSDELAALPHKYKV